MSRVVFVMPAARLDMIDAHDWYERKQQGLGAQFSAEVGLQIERVAANPLHFPRVRGEVRRARLRRFPYSLFFRDLADGIHVIACFHSSRDPLVWQKRL